MIRPIDVPELSLQRDEVWQIHARNLSISRLERFSDKAFVGSGLFRWCVLVVSCGRANLPQSIIRGEFVDSFPTVDVLRETFFRAIIYPNDNGPRRPERVEFISTGYERGFRDDLNRLGVRARVVDRIEIWEQTFLQLAALAESAQRRRTFPHND